MKPILVVDDEWDSAEVMIYLLEREGFVAQYAPNGKVALQMLMQEPAALLLTDYMMPVMDGHQLLETLRDKNETAEIPVVMVSALQEQVVRKAGGALKAFLRKPVRADQLLNTVRQILGPSQ